MDVSRPPPFVAAASQSPMLKSQDSTSWKGRMRIIKANSWLYVGTTQKSDLEAWERMTDVG